MLSGDAGTARITLGRRLSGVAGTARITPRRRLSGDAGTAQRHARSHTYCSGIWEQVPEGAGTQHPQNPSVTL